MIEGVGYEVSTLFLELFIPKNLFLHNVFAVPSHLVNRKRKQPLKTNFNFKEKLIEGDRDKLIDGDKNKISYTQVPGWVQF